MRASDRWTCDTGTNLPHQASRDQTGNTVPTAIRHRHFSANPTKVAPTSATVIALGTDF